MYSIKQRRLPRWLVPLFPLAILAAACTLGALLLSSCGQEQPIVPRTETFEAVPILRVLLTPTPVQMASLTTTGGYGVQIDGNTVLSSTSPMPPTEVRRHGRQWRFNGLDLEGREVIVQPSGDSCVRNGQLAYRGMLQLLPEGDSAFGIVNHVDLESYLAGVLPKELLAGWSGETYGALAVAARTFALYHKRNFGASHDYDVGADQAWQVYGGISAESPKAWKAIRATHGIVLAYGPEGEEQIFMAQYSACCGGHVNGAYVIRDAPRIEPLYGGQECDDCRRCPLYRWGTVRISKENLCRAIAAAYPSERSLDDVNEIRVTSEASSGRAVWLDVIGPRHAVRLRAEDLRLALLRNGAPEANKLYSMNCRIRVLADGVEFYDGRGFGHGVGLCQWGAQGKAERSWTAQQILEFYYPGARLMKAY